MSEKVEGTVILDGLLEGRVPDASDAAAALRQWVSFAESLGLRFSLELEGSALSLLADDRPFTADALGGAPSAVIADALRQLLKLFPAPDRAHLFSTLRSIEYRKGLEVRTLYAIAPSGELDVRQEAAEARTTPAPQPLTRREKLRQIAMGILVAAAILGISAIFVDYRALFSSIADAARPLDPEKIEVDTQAFKDYFTVEGKRVARGGRALILTLKRTPAFPLKDADCQALADKAGNALPARLSLDAIARGYVRCEYFNKSGEFMGFTLERIRGLRDQESIELPLPVAGRRDLQRIVITY
ncbi:MAG: hypothetical protein FJ290_27265 [Planctomycetes bacterium]|nr:hypothetical protein [Planctomycetota bacterium]